MVSEGYALKPLVNAETAETAEATFGLQLQRQIIPNDGSSFWVNCKDIPQPRRYAMRLNVVAV